MSQIWIKVSTTWRSVSQGWINVGTNIAEDWRQFFSSSAATYTFSFGNTVHIGTNGYIALDSGQSTINIASTTGRVLGILPADLELNSIRYAADSSKFYVFYRGKRYGGTNFEIEYEVHFIDGQNYALIKLVAFPSSTYSRTGYYISGSNTGYSGITTTRTVGAEYRVYFGTTAAFTTSFTEYGTSTHPVWLAQGSLTSGTADDGYISVVGSQGSSAQAPTSVTASSITGSAATVSWSAITNANAGMSAIQSYDYSINGGSSWTSTGTSTSANITGLSGSTSYTVLVRANNYFFTGTNYGSVTFSTLAGAPTITSLTASAPTTSSTQLVLVTVTWTSTNQASYFLNVLQPFVANYLDYGTTETSSSQSHGSGNNFQVYSGASVSISLTVYNGAGQTGDSATSTISYTPPIVVTPTVSSVTATSVTDTTATISWSSTNQASYNITGLPSAYSGSTATSRAVSGLTASTAYTATVTVTSSSGHTASDNVSFTTTATPVLTAGIPTGLSVSRLVGSDFISTSLSPSGSGFSSKTQTWSFGRNTTFTINFTRGSNATDSEMYYSTSSSTPGAGTGQNGGTSSSSSGSFTYTAAASTSSGSDTPYYFWVRSYSGSSTSAWTYAGTQNVDTPVYTAFSIVLYRTSVGNANFTTATPSRNDLSYTWTDVNTSFSHQAQVRLTFDGTARTANS